MLKRGEIDLAVGTHALIQKDVAFRRLGLVITDEQHRFGVGQRAALADKGGSPFACNVRHADSTHACTDDLWRSGYFHP